MSNLNHDIRRFNRFELKYVVPIRQAEQFREALGAYLLPDDHGDGLGCYDLASLYFDGPALPFYWEKVDGIRWRRKLRLRRYDAGLPLADETPVFVEIKQRLNRVTQKRRVCLPYAQAMALCTDRQTPPHGPEDAPVIQEVLAMVGHYDLRPVSLVCYTRRALVGSEYDLGLRVTFDTALTYRAGAVALADGAGGAALFPADWVVVEIKVNERIPYWLTDLVARHGLNLARVSKYCRSIELAGDLPAPAGHLALA